MKLKSLHYLWSKKDRWGSKLISWASNETTPLENTPAHVALLVNEKWVFESTYSKNVSCISYKRWKEINIETHILKCNQERDYDEVKKVFKDIKGKNYDWLGICYFIWRFLLFFAFKTSMPKKNKWEDPNAYFCCEAVGKITGSNYSMKTPAELYLELKEVLE